ncbi:unnamed protein product [Cuscuta epithymum]|uniref:Uncharacterized protein n=1 Tax=Cuscuta epithymum TaxID=186058 RepID=A0AAV0FP91_9ASTE|nr:unnamed protein product [Cuscuta epithymum]
MPLGDMAINFQKQILIWKQESQNCSIRGAKTLNEKDDSITISAQILQPTEEGYLQCYKDKQGQNMEQETIDLNIQTKEGADFVSPCTSGGSVPVLPHNSRDARETSVNWQDRVMKCLFQKFVKYWEGRSARMKKKKEILVATYLPP